MLILTLETKPCMSQLLLKETFDSFSFIEGEITTYNRFTIDGHIHKTFFEDPPACDYSSWKDLKDYCCTIIKGKRTPLSFKLIFSLAREEFPAFLADNQLSYRPEEIQGLYLNIRFDGSSLQCITGTSLNTFTMDKSIDTIWDSFVKTFFHTNHIPWECE